MIEILFFDVDGCLSDGGLYYSNFGDELKKFDVKDGFGIYQWNKMGKISAIITGKTSKIVEIRAKELGIKHVRQGVSDKLSVAREILALESLEFENSAAIGDDLNDQKLLNSVSLSFKPNDAIQILKTDITLSRNGGKGAVREMIEFIIKKENLEKEWLSKWL